MSPQVAMRIAFFGFVLDRALKYFAHKAPQFADGVFAVPGMLGFKLHLNTVFAWSLPISNTVALCLAVFVLAAVVYVLFKKRAHREWAGLWLVLAGAASNIGDRIFYGGVIDYAVVPLGGVVNLADALVVAGVGLLVFPRALYAR